MKSDVPRGADVSNHKVLSILGVTMALQTSLEGKDVRCRSKCSHCQEINTIKCAYAIVVKGRADVSAVN